MDKAKTNPNTLELNLKMVITRGPRLFKASLADEINQVVSRVLDVIITNSIADGNGLTLSMTQGDHSILVGGNLVVNNDLLLPITSSDEERMDYLKDIDAQVYVDSGLLAATANCPPESEKVEKDEDEDEDAILH